MNILFLLLWLGGVTVAAGGAGKVACSAAGATPEIDVGVELLLSVDGALLPLELVPVDAPELEAAFLPLPLPFPSTNILELSDESEPEDESEVDESESFDESSDKSSVESELLEVFEFLFDASTSTKMGYFLSFRPSTIRLLEFSSSEF